MSSAGKPRVFVSHAQEDADFANALREWLDEAVLGAVSFFVSSDRGSIPLGTEWASRIRDALTESKLMLVLVSPASVTRRWLHFEAGAGYSRGIAVVPVCVAGMRLPEVEPPLSLLEGVELPGSDAEARLLQLIADSADLRVPKAPPRLVLPERTSGLGLAETARVAPTTLAGQPLSDLTKAKAAALLGEADQHQVDLVRALVKEALFALDIQRWPGNHFEPPKALGALRANLRSPVLIPHDVAESFLEHAEKVAAVPYDPEPTDRWDSRFFDRVKEMVDPYLDVIPSLGDYELALFQHPPEIYVPLLFLELRTTEGYQNWNAIRIAADGEFGRVVLPQLERALRDHKPPNPEYWQSVEIGRELLGSAFDKWHHGLRGRSVEEEVDAYRQSFAKDSAETDQ
jgi:hypothetical protein